MDAPLAPSIIDILMGLQLGPIDGDASNRCELEGLTLGSSHPGMLEIGIRRLEATSLRLASGPLMLEIGRIVLDKLVAQVRIDEGRPRLCAAEAVEADLSGVKLHGPLIVPQPKGQEALHQGGAPASGDAMADRGV